MYVSPSEGYLVELNSSFYENTTGLLLRRNLYIISLKLKIGGISETAISVTISSESRKMRYEKSPTEFP